jgi:hypothetical protein
MLSPILESPGEDAPDPRTKLVPSALAQWALFQVMAPRCNL